jgi:hypothetical protein
MPLTFFIYLAHRSIAPYNPIFHRLIPNTPFHEVFPAIGPYRNRVGALAQCKCVGRALRVKLTCGSKLRDAT